jgi:hypothetical protein
MADVRVKWVGIFIASVTQAIYTTAIKTFLPHDLDVQDKTLRMGFVILRIGKFAMCE